MKTRIHIVANCADRKRLQVPPQCMLRMHHARSGLSRLASFLRTLESARGVSAVAEELYVGPYWAVVRDLPVVAASRGLEASLWVASAGYGLVPGSARLHGYSATFRVGEPDSVPSTDEPFSITEQLTAWWAGLSEWAGPSGKPRRIADLASAEPKAYVMVVSSPRYVQAMSEDLRSALKYLGPRLIIVTSHRLASSDPLAANVVLSEERLLPVVEGARPALHARVARHILAGSRSSGLDAHELRSRYARLAARAGFTRVPTRKPMTDAEVKRYLRQELHRAPRLSYTRALRVLRSRGRACEQKRFKGLFGEVVGRVN